MVSVGGVFVGRVGHVGRVGQTWQPDRRFCVLLRHCAGKTILRASVLSGSNLPCGFGAHGGAQKRFRGARFMGQLGHVGRLGQAWQPERRFSRMRAKPWSESEAACRRRKADGIGGAEGRKVFRNRRNGRPWRTPVRRILASRFSACFFSAFFSVILREKYSPCLRISVPPC